VGLARRWCFAPAFVVVALLTGIYSLPASAALRVDVTQGNIQPLPIAIPDFNGGTEGQNIAGVVRADLQRSGLFRPLDPKSFLEQVKDINASPDFANWRVINAQALVVGQATVQPDGALGVGFRLWDVFGGTEMVNHAYNTTSATSWRQVAHMISDAI
jgi:TolB protein